VSKIKRTIAVEELFRTSKESEVIAAVLLWMRTGPTHSSIQLHKGASPKYIKARLEVSGGLEVLGLTNKLH
jgi:hypothetical protein